MRRTSQERVCPLKCFIEAGTVKWYPLEEVKNGFNVVTHLYHITGISLERVMEIFQGS
jgi:hypothetical protein